MKKGKLHTWFEWFKKWVSDFIHRVDKPQAEIIVDEVISKDRLSRAKSVIRDMPGAVSTWYIEHSKHEKTKILVTLDNLFELKTFSEISFLEEDTSINVKRTHKVSIIWLLKIGAKNKEIIKYKGSWIADLQGNSGSINSKAVDIIKFLIQDVVNLTPTVSSNWIERLDKYPWEESITAKTRLISSLHKPYLLRIQQNERRI